MKPFLKWAGGKRWLTAHEYFEAPGKFNRYIEPFLGSGAVFFSMAPNDGILSDINGELINLYRVIRDEPVALLDLMKEHHDRHSKEYYYDIRAEEFSCRIEQAARTLYLNRTCFNGLYRVNLKGEFNVPIGTKSSVVFPNEDFEIFSGRLQHMEIVEADFETTIDRAQAADFLYIDPPYTVLHNMNGFVKYNDKIFSWSDQIRLRDAIVRAGERKVQILLSNADHPSIRELYEGVGNMMSVPRNSVISGKSSSRTNTTEILIEI